MDFLPVDKELFLELVSDLLDFENLFDLSVDSLFLSDFNSEETS
jgi:hypothetical protein